MYHAWLTAICWNSDLFRTFMMKECVEFSLLFFGTEKPDCVMTARQMFSLLLVIIILLLLVDFFYCPPTQIIHIPILKIWWFFIFIIIFNVTYLILAFTYRWIARHIPPLVANIDIGQPVNYSSHLFWKFLITFANTIISIWMYKS